MHLFLLCMLNNHACFLWSVDCLKYFSNISFRNTIRVSHSLDPDQSRRFVEPVLEQTVCNPLSANELHRQCIKSDAKLMSSFLDLISHLTKVEGTCVQIIFN